MHSRLNASQRCIAMLVLHLYSFCSSARTFVAPRRRRYCAARLFDAGHSADAAAMASFSSSE
jgi:hypothetical protein